MRKRTIGSLIAGVALGLVFLTGCGGGSDTVDGTTATGGSRSEPAIPPVVEDLVRRLQAAGIPAKATAFYDGESQVEVRGAEIVYYADPSEAAKEGAGLLQVATGHPQKAMADAYGQVVVWTVNEQPLTSAERARFEEISKIVDPQR